MVILPGGVGLITRSSCYPNITHLLCGQLSFQSFLRRQHPLDSELMVFMLNRTCFAWSDLPLMLLSFGCDLVICVSIIASEAIILRKDDLNTLFSFSLVEASLKLKRSC